MTLKEILKTNKKSYTEERQTIFDIIKSLHHFDYLLLQNYLEKKWIKIWRASIFRTLNLFLELNILKNIYNDSGQNIYEYNDNRKHHEHMKCKKCWIFIEFDDSEIHNFLEKIAKDNNFKLLNHSINLEWFCENCNK